MPSLVLHLAILESLPRHPALPPHVASALDEDLPYARFGAAFPTLGTGGVRRLLGTGIRAPAARGFGVQLHGTAPVALGLKMAELVANGALVGSEPGLALVTGYFAHLCLDRALHATEARLAVRHCRPGETLAEARARVCWMQTLFFLRERDGDERVGRPGLRRLFQLSKGGPLKRVGGGILEVVRLASRETLGVAPERAEVDAWVRRLALAGWLLSGPLGRARRLPPASALSERELYRGPDVDVRGLVQEALSHTAAVMERVAGLMARQRFTLRARERFIGDFPEGAPVACSA
jgi:hypothetical protein